WGGGALYAPYKEHFLSELQKLGVGVQEVNQLPVPVESFQVPDDVASFGRLAIAYGLSFHKANLEAVRLPNQLQTFDELYPDYFRERAAEGRFCSCWANPSCPKCFGTGFIQPSDRGAIVSGQTTGETLLW